MMEDREYRNWTELPPEITSSILHRLGTIEILENAQKVCKSWHRVCTDPSMWRKIDIENRGDLASFKYDLESMCRHAVDRSQGGLVEIDIWYFGTDELLDYIAESASFSSSLSTVSSLMNDEELRNWAELPPELISSILVWLGAIDILENVQKVCRLWCHICKDPSMWRKIDMDNLGDLGAMGYDLEIMCRHAVDRSQGGLVEIDIWYFGTDELLNYIADRSSNLRSLRLRMCYSIADEGFIEAVVKLPLLEYLEVSHCSDLSGESLRVVGQSCPNLKTLKLNSEPDPNFNDDEFNNDDALAIAESMPELRHLQLFGNILTNVGLNAILDGCLHLEHLDLRKCFNVDLTGDLEKRCIERIKDLKRPNDSTAGHPYGRTFTVDVPYDNSDYYWY